MAKHLFELMRVVFYVSMPIGCMKLFQNPDFATYAITKVRSIR